MKKYGIKLFLLVFVALISFIIAEGTHRNAFAQNKASLRMGETRATLDPSIFSDPRVQSAYQAAKEIPAVLDSIYCYCQCEESPAFKHKSLLSCYVDRHAST